MSPFLPTEPGPRPYDVILVSGDAYVDHPSFAAAIIGRALEAAGFSVAILPQPDWRTADPFRRLGRPNLFFGVTAGNLDSMVAHYTAQKRRRRDDAYSPEGEAGHRPDRASIVYTQRCREAFPGVPIVLGGLEASLRRIAHYDYWTDSVRRSLLLDAKADLLVYGQGEKPVVALARRLASGTPIAQIDDLPGTARVVADPESLAARLGRPLVELPSHDEVLRDKRAFARASHLFHREQNPDCAALVVQRHGNRAVAILPPSQPPTTAELDALYALPFARAPHPMYGKARIPAWEQIQNSIAIVRGCLCGCSFCAITEHQGKHLSSRSPESILREVDTLAATSAFRGTLSDLGGPTANLWAMGCTDDEARRVCRRPSCVHPTHCVHLKLDHGPLIALYKAVRARPRIKHVFVASGVRYDLAEADTQNGTRYLRELITHHVSGQLKVAPEHLAPNVLKLMRKPGFETFERFRRQFEQLTREAGKEQYLIPYFITGHPGCGLGEATQLHDYLKRHHWKPQQVQDFIPTPMTLATDMFHSGLDPRTMEPVATATDLAEKRQQKALLRWDDPGQARNRRLGRRP